MIPDIKLKPKIVVDTSFWINIVSLGLDRYLIKYFDVYFVSKVEKEILDDNEFKMYDSIDMEQYSKSKDMKSIIIKDPRNISKKLIDNLQHNSGELYSTALAIEEEMILATDDKGAIEFCSRINIPILTTIDYILFLYDLNEQTLNDVNKYLYLLKGKIKSKYID